MAPAHEKWRMEEVTYPVRDRPTHARDERHTASVTPSDHLLGGSLRRHEYTRDIDLEHQIRVLGCIFERRRFLLYSCCGKKAIQPSLGVRYILDYLI